MKKAKLILSAVALLAVAGGAVAFKATRSLNTFYSVDVANSVPSLRLCTKAVQTTYTTDPQLAIPQAPAITQTTYYTTRVNSTSCPATILFSAE
ncbi:hypothetical protein SAMN05428949_4830 [Chitinophaga sp. YR627]|uniref:hypothetical protein n=1 Tax=Chitinophaga sp. YR627 TaxID=1881041 RepID=UPI0008F3040A|nr:hypothetical protein [Chitinophaga sp. YR627]SFO29571.1 hypothetical protein SAMN05428949_4830 [Chitinophaga sp. YR627]